ncbi:PHP domain-containing protein [Candidatus Poribacteria bacterium]
MELLFDLHVHTNFSDGFLSPQGVVSVARKKGLSGLAITDHNTIAGAVRAKRFVENNKIKDFTVIVGAEISTQKGHITGLFLQDEIRSRDFHTVVEEIKRQEGLVVAAHPLRIPLLNRFRKKPTMKLSRDDLRLVDFIEVWNCRSKRKANVIANELAQQHQKPALIGSDAHFPSELGRARVIVRTSDVTDEALRSVLLQRKYNVSLHAKSSLPWYYLSAILKRCGYKQTY